MARPRTIAPNGDTAFLGATVSAAVKRDLEKRAKREKKSLSALVREALEKAAA